MNLSKSILLALVAGIIAGIIGDFLPDAWFLPVDEYVLQPLGRIFISLIKMVVVPVVLCSIAAGVFQLGDVRAIGRIGCQALVIFAGYAVLAIAISIGMAYLIRPGAVPGLQAEAARVELEEAPGIKEALLGIIPENPVMALASGNMLQIIFFALLLGIAISLLGDRTDTLKKFITEINEVMMRIVHLVMYTAPFGAFALIASAIGTNGVGTLRQMALYVLVVVLSLIVHFVVVYGGSMRLLAGMGLIEFVKKFSPAMVVAFGTSSSNATLPVAIETAQRRLQISPPVASFVQSLGATINMDGTAIMQGAATIFIAQVYHIDLSAGQILMVLLTALLASLGTAGVPAVGLVMLTMVLNQVGLPVEGIGLIIGVDRILDMLRTIVNVSGDAVCAVIIDRRQKAKTG